uniref:Uncharacterized protein n=1 Tax=Cacopsylla melanoneura TaxID=428564 RepID=A0A8D9AAF3_9HEMI
MVLAVLTSWAVFQQMGVKYSSLNVFSNRKLARTPTPTGQLRSDVFFTDVSCTMYLGTKICKYTDYRINFNGVITINISQNQCDKPQNIMTMTLTVPYYQTNGKVKVKQS